RECVGDSSLAVSRMPRAVSRPSDAPGRYTPRSLSPLRKYGAAADFPRICRDVAGTFLGFIGHSLVPLRTVPAQVFLLVATPSSSRKPLYLVLRRLTCPKLNLW